VGHIHQNVEDALLLYRKGISLRFLLMDRAGEGKEPEKGLRDEEKNHNQDWGKYNRYLLTIHRGRGCFKYNPWRALQTGKEARPGRIRGGKKKVNGRLSVSFGEKSTASSTFEWIKWGGKGLPEKKRS